MLTIILPSYKKPEDVFIESIEDSFPGCEIIISRDRDGRGKGWAIRQALEHAKGEYIAFLDSDGDLEPRMLLRLLPFIEDCEAVCGSKRINHKHFSRRVVTVLSRIYIRLMFGIVADTQTGIKLFRRRAIKEWVTDGFFFDAEILSHIDNDKIIEVPVEANITEPIRKGAIWKTLKESLILKSRLLFPAKK